MEPITIDPRYSLADICATEDGREALRLYLNQKVELGRREQARSREIGANLSPRGTAQFTLTSDDSNLPSTQRIQDYEGPGQAFTDRTLYEPLYNITQDETLDQDIRIDLYGPYGMMLEAISPTGEVRFGTVGTAQRTLAIVTYAGGFEITEDMIVYNQRHRVERMAVAAGRADIKLRNHIHFSPILSGTYAGARNVAFQTTAETANVDANRIINTLQVGLEQVPNASYLVVPQSLIWRLAAALNFVYPNQRPAAVTTFLDMGRVIVYRGSSVRLPNRIANLEETFAYPGVPANQAFLVTPGEQLESWVKHYLRITTETGDMSRLIAQQFIARERLGVYADLTGELGTVRLNFA